MIQAPAETRLLGTPFRQGNKLICAIVNLDVSSCVRRYLVKKTVLWYFEKHIIDFSCRPFAGETKNKRSRYAGPNSNPSSSTERRADANR